MTTSTNLTNDKTITELDQIIRQATEQKAALYDAELDRLLDEIEQRCEELALSLPALLAIAKKRRRKARAHKANGSEE